MTEEIAPAAPGPAALVAGWRDAHLSNTELSRSVVAWNRVAEALPDLIAALEAPGAVAARAVAFWAEALRASELARLPESCAAFEAALPALVAALTQG